MTLERMANHVAEDMVRKDYDKAYNALYEAIKELEDSQEMAKIERDPEKNKVLA